MNVKKFVVGFIFNADLTRVLMIRKARPEWMANRLNGIGGHVEEGETFLAAIVREVREETGLEIKREDFIPYVTIHRQDRQLVCFWTIAEPRDAKSTTDEQVEIHDIECLLSRQDIVVDTKWILAMAREAASEAPGYMLMYNIFDHGMGGPWERLA